MFEYTPIVKVSPILQGADTLEDAKHVSGLVNPSDGELPGLYDFLF
jgi:hypothetical protein